MDSVSRAVHQIELDQRSVWLAVIREQSECAVLSRLRSKRSAEHTTFRSIGPEVCALVSIGYRAPNGMVLVAGGFDQDNSVPPDPNRATKGTQNMNRL
jgi:hypothetical protein